MEEVWYCFLNKKQLGERWIVFSAAKEGRNLSMAQFSICSRYIFCSCLDSVMEGVREEVGLSSASSCVFSQGIVLWESCSNGGFSTATRRRRGWSCRHGIVKQGNWKMLLYSRSVSSCTGLFPAFEAFPRESEWRAIYAVVDPVYSEQRLGLKVLLTCACGASAVLPQECSYVKGSVTHSITVPPLFFSGSRMLCLAGRGRLCLKNKKTNFWTRSETLLFLSLELLCPMLHRRGGLLASESLDFCQTIFVPQEPPTFPFSDKCSSGRPLSFAKQCSFMSVCLKSFSSGKLVAVFVLLCTLLFGNSLAYRKVNAQL